MAKRSDKTDVAERLRADLLVGSYRPGEWLRQIDIETAYGVTRFEVRQALSQLVVARLLEHVPNRGYRVVQTSQDERSHMTDVRLLLEIPAAQAVLDHVSPADIERIAQAAQAFDTALDTKPPAQLQALNHQFHRAMFDCCGNPALAGLIHDLREREVPGTRDSWTTMQRMRASSQDHLDMVAALRDRDGAALAQACQRHLNRWRSDAA
ncbi:Transcriptional regulator [Devosia sp. LC5]|uniref:GntR family transcriptional regulator n=1 Tax=Devosia sp. LC5 TaxID=1502724 RepID=UPI0004E36C16|nr:GntR family transcriptional regulator [Devosia sp. LC5]KFC67196.1 Transcriptional regulator [Devosia sp. LC5]